MKHLILHFFIFPSLTFAGVSPAQKGSTLKIFDSVTKNWRTETLSEIHMNYVLQGDDEVLSSVLLVGETSSCEVHTQTIESQKVPVQMIVDFMHSRRIDAHCWLQSNDHKAQSFSMRTYLE